MSESSDNSRDPKHRDEEPPLLADFLRNNADVPLDTPAAARDDCFGPPQTPVECFCLHCGHIYMSDLLLAVDVDGTIHYACPVKDCDAMGYKFDIFPVNDDDDEDGGWVECDEDAVFDDEESGFTEADSEFAEAVDPDGAVPFDPPHDWSPDADAEEDGGEEEEPRYFTRDDYDVLKASGEYDRRAEEIRAWWRQCEADRKDPTSPRYSNSEGGDDDIPF